MSQCVAVRVTGSMDPCGSPALYGHRFCSRHARMKHPILWVTANQPRTLPLVRVQAVIRGWLLRRRLAIAGPGVLNRKGLANDDDFATCVEMSRVSPMDYFGFEENGKQWGFSFDSLWAWAIRSVTPVNPYTKVPLSIETRKRLRAVWTYRFRRALPCTFESHDIQTRIRHRWTVLCQHFADYGFMDIDIDMLLSFTSLDLTTMFVLLERDIEVILPESHPFRNRLLKICRKRIESSTEGPYPLRCANSLLYMLSLPPDSYALTFSIMSALFRC